MKPSIELDFSKLQIPTKTPPIIGPRKSPKEIAAFKRPELKLAHFSGCSGYFPTRISFTNGRQSTHLFIKII